MIVYIIRIGDAQKVRFESCIQYPSFLTKTNPVLSHSHQPSSTFSCNSPLLVSIPLILTYLLSLRVRQSQEKAIGRRKKAMSQCNSHQIQDRPFKQVDELIRSKKFKQAFNLLQGCNSPKSLLKKCEISIFLSNSETALKYAKELRNKYKDRFPQASLLIAQAYFMKGSYDRSIFWCDSYLQECGYDRLQSLKLKAQSLFRLNRHSEAIDCFRLLTQLRKNQFQLYQRIGDSLRILDKRKQAAHYYGIVLNLQSPSRVFTKLADLFIEMGLLDLAQKEVERNLSIDSSSSKLHLLKGKLLKLRNDQQGENLQYLKAIQLDAQTEAVIQSSKLLLKNKIRKGLYYEAQYLIQRAFRAPQFYDCQLQELTCLVQGTVSMIKGNHEEGLQKLGAANSTEFRELLNQLKAYGNFALGNIDQALSLIQKLQESDYFTNNTIYNKNMLLGFKMAKSKNFLKSILFFQHAQKVIPHFSDPYLCQAISVLKSKKHGSTCLEVARSLLERALKFDKQNYTVLFMLGVISISTGRLEEALQYSSKAYELSEVQDMRYDYLQSLCLFATKNYQFAIGKLARIINYEELSDLLQKALKLRCLSNSILGNREAAFADLNFIVQSFSNQGAVGSFVGDVFYANEDYEQAAKIYQLSIMEGEQKVLLCKIRSELGNKNIDTLILDIQKYLFKDSRHAVRHDYQLLKFLRKIYQETTLTLEHLPPQHGILFTRQDIQFVRAIQCLYSNRALQAASILKEMLSLPKQRQTRMASQGQLGFCLYVALLGFDKQKAKAQIKSLQNFLSLEQILRVRRHQQNIVSPFNLNKKIARFYPPIQIANIGYRLSFDLPPPDPVTPTIDLEQQALSLVAFANLPFRPSAPWIRRSEQGVQFTEECVQESIDLESRGSTVELGTATAKISRLIQ